MSYCKKISCIRQGDPEARCEQCDRDYMKLPEEQCYVERIHLDLTDEQFLDMFVGDPAKKAIADRYLFPENDPFYQQMQKLVAVNQFPVQKNIIAAQIPPHNAPYFPPANAPAPAPPTPKPIGVFKGINVTKTSYAGGRSNAQALSLAQSNGWDVVVPRDDELFIDIDSQEQLNMHYRAMSAFDKNICPIRDHIEQPSKSGDPGKVHIYIRLDMSTHAPLTDSDRIMYQSMLCSDAVREMLSLSRLNAGDKYPTLFFEKHGARPSGFGNLIQQGHVSVVLAGGTGGLVSSVPKPVIAAPKYFSPPQRGFVVTAKPAPTATTVAPDPNDPSRYPHQCPKCGGPSYNGLMSFDCKKGCKP